jgi:dephospho-CoA kinase
MGIKIGLTGKMRSGKDTVGDYLKNEYGFKTFSFAEGIKFVCGSVGLELAEGGKQRALYQAVGQDLRKHDPDIWVKYTFSQINRYCTIDDNIVITDVRQPNEVEALKVAGYKIIKIHADPTLRIKRMESAGDYFNPGDLIHETERAVDTLEADITINNNGTITDLHYKVNQLMLKMFNLYGPTICRNKGGLKWAN